jgi:hypothetical protein
MTHALAPVTMMIGFEEMTMVPVFEIDRIAYYSYFKVIPGFRVYIFGSSPFPVSQAAEVERGMSCLK